MRTQANLAVATAEEAMARTREFSVKVSALDEQHVSITTVSQKIDEASEKPSVQLQILPGVGFQAVQHVAQGDSQFSGMMQRSYQGQWSYEAWRKTVSAVSS